MKVEGETADKRLVDEYATIDAAKADVHPNTVPCYVCGQPHNPQESYRRKALVKDNNGPV